MMVARVMVKTVRVMVSVTRLFVSVHVLPAGPEMAAT